MNAQKSLNKTHAQRKNRARAKISGTAERPRLSIFKSNQYLYAQLIDDTASKTILSASTMEKEKAKATSADAVAHLIETLAKEMGAKGIKQAVLDRGQYKYHGVVKTIAEEMRKRGITI
jgi:large subunit ribosomal protein L18